TLAVGELQVQHTAVRFHQGESIELAFVASVFEYSEVPPIDLEALAGRRFHTQKGSARFQLWASGMHILAQDGVSGAIAERPQPPGRQDVVVCKIPKPAVCRVEVLLEPRLALELSCCLQDSPVRRPAAIPLRRNALGRKLSCCLQDRAGAVFGPERAEVGDS